MSSSTDPSSQAPAPGGEYAENLDILRTIPLFAGVPLESLKVAAFLCKRIGFKPDDNVFGQGETDDRAYHLLAGRAALSWTAPEDKGGEVRVLAEFGPGDFLGGLALFGSATRLFSLTALTPLTVLILSREKFLAQVLKDRHATEHILKNVAQGVVRFEETKLRELAEAQGLTCLGGLGVSLL